MDFLNEINLDLDQRESTFTQVQLVDEFLDSFSLFEVSNQALVQQAINFINPVLGGNQIAQGEG